MFEIVVQAIFKISGRGTVVAGEILNRATNLRNGDILTSKDDIEQKVLVKSFELINFGSRHDFNPNQIAFLSDITEEVGATLIGKTLYKDYELTHH